MVTIQIIDVNDETPQFILDGEDFSVTENSTSVGIGFVRAIDLDEDDVDNLSYSIA